MSHPFDQKELMDLVDAVCRDALDHDSWIRLEELLLANRDARAMYRRYVNSHIGLKQYLATREVGPPQKPAKSPVLGMLGTGVQRVVDFCWSATPFSILVAVGLPLVCVLLLVIQVRRPEPIQNATVSAPVRVARLNRTLDCEWTDEAPTPVVGESFATDRHIGLVRGLAEMTMADGTTVIVEGPATLRFRSPREVSLKSGKLTAQVPKRARGFTVMTPRVSVVDLGTEF
ncbi:MAG: FecR domain-containing protein, partial [Pirellulales bacterium]|nr:FecR domain-containing protein [Pirellulales bacterium]